MNAKVGQYEKKAWISAIAAIALALVGSTSRAIASPVVSQESRFIEIDEIKAAAERGNAEAQNRFGLYYDWGAGVPHDSERAVYWWIKGTKQGNVAAQFSLMLMR